MMMHTTNGIGAADEDEGVMLRRVVLENQHASSMSIVCAATRMHVGDDICSKAAGTWTCDTVRRQASA